MRDHASQHRCGETVSSELLKSRNASSGDVITLVIPTPHAKSYGPVGRGKKTPLVCPPSTPGCLQHSHSGCVYGHKLAKNSNLNFMLFLRELGALFAFLSLSAEGLSLYHRLQPSLASCLSEPPLHPISELMWGVTLS